MITADALARELGITLADIQDIMGLALPPKPDTEFPNGTDRLIRAHWRDIEARRARSSR